MLDDTIDDWDVYMNFTIPEEIVPYIKRVNITLQDLFHVNSHCLPFRKIPLSMIMYLKMSCTNRLDYFIAHEGISNINSYLT